MNITIKFGTEDVDWVALCEIFRLAPLGTREPEKLKMAAENSCTVCSAYAGSKIIGFGNLKTGMGLFPNPQMSRKKGYLE